MSTSIALNQNVASGLAINLSTDQLSLVAGDVIAVTILQSSGFARATIADAKFNWLAIRQVPTKLISA